MKMARSIYIGANFPAHLWKEAVRAAAYVMNWITTKALVNSTPFEALLNCKPDVSHLRIIECSAFVFVPKELCSKFGATSIKTIFLGYDDATKGYRCYNPVTKKIIISSNMAFIEHAPRNFLSSAPSFDMFAPQLNTSDPHVRAKRGILVQAWLITMQGTMQDCCLPTQDLYLLLRTFLSMKKYSLLMLHLMKMLIRWMLPLMLREIVLVLFVEDCELGICLVNTMTMI